MDQIIAASSSDYATLHPLTEPLGDDVGNTFLRMAEALEGSFELPGRKQKKMVVTVVSKDRRRQWLLVFSGSKCKCSERSVVSPDFELIVRESAWWDIASGRLSPMDVFGQGKMRIRGDMTFGEALYRALARDDGTATVCGGSNGS